MTDVANFPALLLEAPALCAMPGPDSMYMPGGIVLVVGLARKLALAAFADRILRGARGGASFERVANRVPGGVLGSLRPTLACEDC